MIPFSVFLIIPGLEILLPPYLLIFPNAKPSQFMSEEAKNKKFQQISERRDKAAKYLFKSVPKYLETLGKEEHVLSEDVGKIKDLANCVHFSWNEESKGKVLPTDLLQYKEIFKKYGRFKYFDNKTLLSAAYFMSL